MLTLTLLDAAQVERIYHEQMVHDFPQAELKPLAAILELIERGIYDCFGLWEDGSLRAYAYFVGEDEQWRLLDYYAVLAPYRGCGYGSRFLQMLLARYAKAQGIFVEIESPSEADDAQEAQKRRRRRDFYYRGGLKDSGLSCRLFAVDYDILFYGAAHLEPMAAQAKLAAIYQLMLPPDLYRKNVHFKERKGADTMNYQINGYQPEKLFHFFEDISAIPRSSGEEQALSDYLLAFAKARGLEALQDQWFNLVIKKPASAGYENQPAVMLQGHLDMVCEKNAATVHDFATEGIKLVVEDGLIKAQGTTLGADNGAAIAMMMAILDDDSLNHPALECVFTVQEETGLTGAEKLAAEGLTAKTMINLDSETEGVATVSCAGGMMIHLDKPLTFGADKPAAVFQVTVQGLLGGHSGGDIHLERGNANLLLGRLLYAVRDEAGFALAQLNGGNKDNAIPREAAAIVGATDGERLRESILAEAALIKRELAATEKDFAVTVEAADAEGFIDSAQSRQILDLLLLAPNGVFNRNVAGGGFVVASSNLGVIRTEDANLRLVFSLRSSVASLQEQTVRKLQELARLLRFNCTIVSQYPGWAYAQESPIRELYCRVYEAKTGRPLVCEAIHAGLECGLFIDKLPGLDAIAVGPQIDNCHTPFEQMSIHSFALNYNVLCEVLAELK